MILLETGIITRPPFAELVSFESGDVTEFKKCLVSQPFGHCWGAKNIVSGPKKFNTEIISNVLVKPIFVP